MDFAYYVVRKKDMTILDGAKDIVSAINMGQQQDYACLIFQGCVITEVGQDPLPDEPQEVPNSEVEVLEAEIEDE